MKTGRNDPCPCGSGKKYKKCCLLKYNSDPLDGWLQIDEWLKEDLALGQQRLAEQEAKATQIPS